MLIKNLLQQSWPVLKYSDSVKTAVQLMYEYGASQLPLVIEGNFIGYFNRETLEALENQKQKLDKIQPENHELFVVENDHLLLSLAKFKTKAYSLLAVVNLDGQYVGSLSQQSVIDYFSNIFSGEQTGIISIGIDYRSYSLSEIARLVEQNDTKILFSYFSENENHDQDSEFVMVINSNKLLPIISTFERYNYKINFAYSPTQEKTVELERLNALFKYLEV